MRKEIFESEEEMMEFLKECVPDDRCLTDDEIVLKAKSLNLIKKSIVEEAEEMYKYLMRSVAIDASSVSSELSCFKDLSMQRYNGLKKLYEAIQYLKQQLEEK